MGEGGGAGGYAQEGYARSLTEFGSPRQLPRSGGWVLERDVSGGPPRDLVGPYPLFSCPSWDGLADDLAELGDPLVSIVLVADPLAPVDRSQLREAFPDHLVTFKRHLVRDLTTAMALPEHHRRHVRRSLRAVHVEVCADPLRHLGEWTHLYDQLIVRHGLSGVRAFSEEAFRQQLALPGMVALRAVRAGVTVGMTLWLTDPPHAYYHLGASAPDGYAVSASYALFAIALEHLTTLGVTLVDLGSGPGATTGDDGLTRFKRGWATGERPAHLCGRVLDRSAYAALAAGSSTGWFPAYRADEVDLPARRSGAALGSGPS